MATILFPPYLSEQDVTRVFHSISQMKVQLGLDMSHLLLLGKFEYGGGPIFKVVLEC